jgi:hypothetical protein
VLDPAGQTVTVSKWGWAYHQGTTKQLLKLLHHQHTETGDNATKQYDGNKRMQCRATTVLRRSVECGVQFLQIFPWPSGAKSLVWRIFHPHSTVFLI